jgi:hypothetical protein
LDVMYHTLDPQIEMASFVLRKETQVPWTTLCTLALIVESERVLQKSLQP